jgi:hypothetical protein
MLIEPTADVASSEITDKKHFALGAGEQAAVRWAGQAWSSLENE